MTRRAKFWMVVAVLFAFLNFGGAVYAAARGELLHTATHVALLLLGAYVGRRIWSRGRSVSPAVPDELTDRLTHLEQSVDAIAIEVERIGEGQRFMTRFFTENSTARAPHKGGAEPIEIKAGEAPQVRPS